MNNKIYVYFSLLLALSLCSCQQQQTENNNHANAEDRELPAEERIEKTIHDEIMAVHDEVMPKMDALMSVKGDLLEKLDSLNDLPEIPEVIVEKLETQVKALENADQGMMGWMHNFQPPTDSATHDDKMRFYREQKAIMEEVKVNMLNAIDSAKQLLESVE